MIFHCSINEHPAHVQSCYSRSSFDPLVFNSCLHDLFNYISRDNSSDPSFLDSWFYLLDLSLEKSLRKKRKKRLALPSYYSSHTIHLLNQKFTNSRKLFRKWSLELSLKQLELSRAVSESIDLDKEVFINQFNLHDTRNCFKLLRSFGFSSLIPTALRNEKSVLYTNSEKAEGFNSYFGSFYRESPITALPSTVEAEIALLYNVNISVLSIEKFLASCADSTLMGNDLFPSFLARDCASQLAPLVAVLFYWILKNQKWPTIWKTSIVTPLHKSGSTALISNYRPISILPVLSLVLERAILDSLFGLSLFMVNMVSFQTAVRLANS